MRSCSIVEQSPIANTPSAPLSLRNLSVRRALLREGGRERGEGGREGREGEREVEGELDQERKGGREGGMGRARGSIKDDVFDCNLHTSSLYRNNSKSR